MVEARLGGHLRLRLIQGLLERWLLSDIRRVCVYLLLCGDLGVLGLWSVLLLLS